MKHFPAKGRPLQPLVRERRPKRYPKQPSAHFQRIPRDDLERLRPRAVELEIDRRGEAVVVPGNLKDDGRASELRVRHELVDRRFQTREVRIGTKIEDANRSQETLSAWSRLDSTEIGRFAEEAFGRTKAVTISENLGRHGGDPGQQEGLKMATGTLLKTRKEGWRVDALAFHEHDSGRNG